MIDPAELLHIATKAGAAGCGYRSPRARLTAHPEMIDCIHCYESKAYAARLREHVLSRERRHVQA